MEAILLVMNDDIHALWNENLALKIELVKQWETNHAEHCGAVIPPWPHLGICKWPLPPILSASIPSEISLLFRLVSGDEQILIMGCACCEVADNAWGPPMPLL